MRDVDSIASSSSAAARSRSRRPSGGARRASEWSRSPSPPIARAASTRRSTGWRSGRYPGIEGGREAAFDAFHAVLSGSSGAWRRAERVIGVPFCRPGEAMVSCPDRRRRRRRRRCRCPRTGWARIVPQAGSSGARASCPLEHLWACGPLAGGTPALPGGPPGTAGLARRGRLRHSGRAHRRFSPRDRRAATIESVPGGSRRTGGRARRGSTPRATVPLIQRVEQRLRP